MAVREVIVLYDNTPTDSINFLTAIETGMLKLDDFTDIFEVLETAVNFNNIKVIKMILDHLHVPTNDMTVKERLAYLQLIGTE